MVSGKLKKILPSLFLTTFLFLQVVALHGFAHKDDAKSVQHCELCHLTMVNQLTPILGTDNTVELLAPVEHTFIPVYNQYNYLFSEKTPVGTLFNRPPPALHNA